MMQQLDCCSRFNYCAKFAASVMLSVGICFDGKGQPHVVEERIKINVKYHINDLLPNLLDD